MAKAFELAKKQREIGVAEFFARNRHLLGFDNKRKALLTTIKEAVDNSLDACEEAKILPEIIVEVIEMGPERMKVIIEDNGPGIVKKQIPNIFAKLLYGSKFHSMKQSRGVYFVRRIQLPLSPSVFLLIQMLLPLKISFSLYPSLFFKPLINISVWRTPDKHIDCCSCI